MVAVRFTSVQESLLDNRNGAILMRCLRRIVWMERDPFENCSIIRVLCYQSLIRKNTYAIPLVDAAGGMTFYVLIFVLWLNHTKQDGCPYIALTLLLLQ